MFCQDIIIDKKKTDFKEAWFPEGPKLGAKNLNLEKYDNLMLNNSFQSTKFLKAY